MSDVDWLPELEPLGDYAGDWDRYFEAIYRFFCDDFVDMKPHFRGKRLGLKRHPIIEEKEATFWHFISEGKVEDERTPDLRRCERIRWPAPVINNSEDENLKIWAEPSGSNQRIFIWFEEESYLVILEDRGKYILPWTAYYVEKEHRRKKYIKRWKRYGAY